MALVTQDAGGSGAQSLSDLYNLINGKNTDVNATDTKTNSGSTNTGKVTNSGSTNTSLSDIVGTLSGNTNGSTDSTSDVNTQNNSTSSIAQHVANNSSTTGGNTSTTSTSGSTNVTTTTGKMDQAGMDAMLKSALESNSGLASVMEQSHSAGMYNSVTQGQLGSDLVSRLIGEIAKGNESQTTVSHIGGSTSTTSGSSNQSTVGGSDITGTNNTTGNTTSTNNTKSNTSSNTNQTNNQTNNTTNNIGGSTTDTSGTIGGSTTTDNINQHQTAGGITAEGAGKLIAAGLGTSVINGLLKGGGDLVKGIFGGGNSGADGAGGMANQEGATPDSLTGGGADGAGGMSNQEGDLPDLGGTGGDISSIDDGSGDAFDLGLNFAKGGLVTKQMLDAARSSKKPKGYADGGLVSDIEDNQQRVINNVGLISAIQKPDPVLTAVGVSKAVDNPIPVPDVVNAAATGGDQAQKDLSSRVNDIANSVAGGASSDLSPDIVKKITSGSDSKGPTSVDNGDGTMYGTVGVTTGGGEGGDSTSFNQQGIALYNKSKMKPGDIYHYYDNTGKYAGVRKIQDGGSAKDMLTGTVKDLAPMVALFASLATMGAGASAMLGGSFAGIGGGAAAAAGGAEATSGLDAMGLLKTAKSMYSVDKMFSTNHSDGGPIKGPGTSTSDSIPANLSNGEYVVNATAVKKVGLPMLEYINSLGKGA